MRTEEARPVRLEDYRPPDWLVETVELDVSLHATASQVRATLMLRPNGSGAPAPLVLDGDALNLQSLKLDRVALPPDQFTATPNRLTITQPPQTPFRSRHISSPSSAGSWLMSRIASSPCRVGR